MLGLALAARAVLHRHLSGHGNGCFDLRLQCTQIGAEALPIKISWILLILALPIAGMIFYFLWGGARQAKQLSLKYVPMPLERQSTRMESHDNVLRLSKELPCLGTAGGLSGKKEGFWFTGIPRFAISGGCGLFADLITRMEKAQKLYLLEYYILAEGKLWDRILRSFVSGRRGWKSKLFLTTLETSPAFLTPRFRKFRMPILRFEFLTLCTNILTGSISTTGIIENRSD